MINSIKFSIKYVFFVCFFAYAAYQFIANGIIYPIEVWGDMREQGLNLSYLVVMYFFSLPPTLFGLFRICLLCASGVWGMWDLQQWHKRCGVFVLCALLVTLLPAFYMLCWSIVSFTFLPWVLGLLKIRVF